MIYDRMERLGCYRRLCPALDALIDRLMPGDAWRSLPLGRTDVAGGDAYITRSTVALEPVRPLYEMHRAFGDIHIALTSGETIACLPRDAIAWPQDHAETLLAHGPEGISLPMAEGFFAIFFPWDAHRPSQGTGSCDKLVGKFRW